jgi:uncharacterized protein with GYD domain
MKYGLVLIRVGAVPPRKILEALRGVEGVTDVYAVFGRFDIVVFIKADDYNMLNGISSEIAMVGGIKSTETLIHGD